VKPFQTQLQLFPNTPPKSGKKWDKDAIIELLRVVSPSGLFRMLKSLYERQVVMEKVSRATLSSNNRGFNAFDAPTLSDMYRKYASVKSITDSKDFFTVKKRLRKYRRQLAEIANENEAKRTGV
jgi:hypothetical protein